MTVYDKILGYNCGNSQYIWFVAWTVWCLIRLWLSFSPGLPSLWQLQDIPMELCVVYSNLCDIISWDVIQMAVLVDVENDIYTIPGYGTLYYCVTLLQVLILAGLGKCSNSSRSGPQRMTLCSGTGYTCLMLRVPGSCHFYDRLGACPSLISRSKWEKICHKMGMSEISA